MRIAQKAQQAPGQLGTGFSGHLSSYKHDHPIISGSHRLLCRASLGLGLGYGVWQQGDGLIARDAGGTWIAGGQLKSALSAQLVSEQSPASRVHIGISFRDQSGEYCRSFALRGATAPVGFACHQGSEWHIKSLVTGQSGEAGVAYRMAGSEMPPLLLKSIEAQIAGEPLDQAGEAAALKQGWQAPAH